MQHKKQVVTGSSAETERLGEAIGRRLHGGEVIELVSDLGGGKTTFVHGLARGLGSNDRVASPTFTISREYQVHQLAHQESHAERLVHFDFYRLNEAGLMADELAESVQDPHAVVVVEWGEIVRDVLPTDKLTVQIQATGEDERRLSLAYPDSLSYLIPGDEA